MRGPKKFGTNKQCTNSTRGPLNFAMNDGPELVQSHVLAQTGKAITLQDHFARSDRGLDGNNFNILLLLQRWNMHIYVTLGGKCSLFSGDLSIVKT